MPMGCISVSIELVKVKPWLQQAITPMFITCGMAQLKVGRINLLAKYLSYHPTKIANMDIIILKFPWNPRATNIHLFQTKKK